jgi:hypothetical protein
MTAVLAPRKVFFQFFVSFLALSCLSVPVYALSDAEEARIEAFFSALSERTDVAFIRNGKEYTTAKAISHLQTKLSRTRKSLFSAEEFIAKVASSSSVSGKPYYIKLPSGEIVTAKEFFSDMLK